jgi:hypothetical protein
LTIPGEVGREHQRISDGDADASYDGGGVSAVLVDELQDRSPVVVCVRGHILATVRVFRREDKRLKGECLTASRRRSDGVGWLRRSVIVEKVVNVHEVLLFRVAFSHWGTEGKLVEFHFRLVFRKEVKSLIFLRSFHLLIFSGYI